MSLFKRLFRKLGLRHGIRCRISDSMHPQPDPHTLKDIGVDPMAVEHRRSERLWRELAS